MHCDSERLLVRLYIWYANILCACVRVCVCVRECFLLKIIAGLGTGASGQNMYGFDLEFHDAVNTEVSCEHVGWPASCMLGKMADVRLSSCCSSPPPPLRIVA